MNQDVLSSILERHANTIGALLPVLHAVQGAFGHVPPESVARIAESLRVSRAEVHGLITFFHDLRLEPGGRTRIQVCRAEACQARGVEEIVAAGERAAGERVCLKTVYCLGLCSVGPAARVGDALHARLDAAALVALIEAA